MGCGDYHAFVVLRADGDVYSTGLNNYGQLGVGDSDNRQRFTLVEGLRVRTCCFQRCCDKRCSLAQEGALSR